MTEAFEPQLPRMWADERAVRQVALNLLSNAIKFTPQGGAITIKVGWTAAGGQYFSVRDTGPGIPEDEIPVVMSSFGRGSLAQKNQDHGRGARDSTQHGRHRRTHNLPMICGKDDHITKWTDAERVAKEVKGPCVFVALEGGIHVGHDRGHLWRTQSADWMAVQLGVPKR